MNTQSGKRVYRKSSVHTAFAFAACGLATACASALHAAEKTFTVSLDGTAQYKTVQSAIDAISPESTDTSIVTIKPGTYKEHLNFPASKHNITIRGEDSDASRTVLTFDRHSGMDDPENPGKKVGTSGSESTLIGSNDFSAENITFENSAGDIGQAVAVRTTGDRIAFHNCRFIGWQDTVFLNRGRQYFEDCEITGAVDFIFGGATAFFDHCRIHIAGNGYIAAPSTPDFQSFGFVFDHCSISGDKPDVRTFLGRPWRAHGNAVFMNCEMSDVVRPQGWNNWARPEREKTARFAEFNSSGPGGSKDQRAPWAKQLNESDAKEYSIEKVVDRWDPKSQLDALHRVDARHPAD